MPQRIKFVYFDIGGVLLYWKAGFEKIALMVDKKAEELVKFFERFDQLLCSGVISAKEADKAFSEKYGVKDFDFVETVVESYIPIPVTHKLLIDLSKKYSIGILSNVYQISYDILFKKKQIPHINYSAIVQSWQEGMTKSNMKLFEIATKKAGVLPEEIFFIDDSSKYIEIAQDFGWKAFLFDNQHVEKSVDQIRRKLGA